MLGPFFGGDYNTRIIQGGIQGGRDARFSDLIHRAGPRVRRIVLVLFLLAEPGLVLSPTRFTVLATGEDDGFGNVIRYREVLIETGWIFAEPKDSCEPPFAPVTSISPGALPFVFIEPIDFPRCFEVIVESPCGFTIWGYQLFADRG